MRSSSSSEPSKSYDENADINRRTEVQTEDGSVEYSDRREDQTQMFSRFTVVGQRRKNRRDSDPRERYYVDWISGPYLRVLIAISLFIVIDAFSTLHIINNGGGEANPFMNWLIQKSVAWFIISKIGTGIAGFLILAVHRFFPMARPLVGILLTAYGGIVIYHIYLLSKIHF